MDLVPGMGYRTFGLGSKWSLAHERLGDIYLTLGDTTAALRHLSAFVELWKDADPDLQPRVQTARRTIARLSTDPPSTHE